LKKDLEALEGRYDGAGDGASYTTGNERSDDGLLEELRNRSIDFPPSRSACLRTVGAVAGCGVLSVMVASSSPEVFSELDMDVVGARGRKSCQNTASRAQSVQLHSYREESKVVGRGDGIMSGCSDDIVVKAAVSPTAK
jgi:hypothetical protein